MTVGVEQLPAGHQTPFVGRIAELAALHRRLLAADDGRSGLILLAGEPGIGKTRTAEELAAIAERLALASELAELSCSKATSTPPAGRPASPPSSGPASRVRADRGSSRASCTWCAPSTVGSTRPGGCCAS